MGVIFLRIRYLANMCNIRANIIKGTSVCVNLECDLIKGNVGFK